MSDKPLVVLDTECYRDYWLAQFKRLDNGKVAAFEQYFGHTLNTRDLKLMMQRCTVITFNGRNYDAPMLALALTGASCEQLKRASDLIILGNLKPWDVEREFTIKIPQWDHIDLIEVVPGMVSLKVYGGRLHCQRMQDLPIEPDAYICNNDPIVVRGVTIDTPDGKRAALREYCDNDLDNTALLFGKFRKQIELREKMSIEYGQDLRSKSDAQIAEAVIRDKVSKLIGWKVKAPPVRARSFKYQPPEYLTKLTQDSQPIVTEVVQRVLDADFIIDSGGYVKMPKELADHKIAIGNGVYRMGIGGLHSTESAQTIVADADTLIIDRDVASYYPAIIIETGLFPKHLGKHFLGVYKDIRDKRILAKNSGNKTVADTLKIVLNGSFGKFGNPWSALYSPDLLIQVTVTGQLSLLMLIERIESIGERTKSGLRVVSANTDGIVIVCPKAQYDGLTEIIKQWERDTGYDTEETRYAGLYSRDVNSYIALKAGGGVKLKGAYAEPEPVASSWPSPHNQICIAAVCDYLEHGVPIDLTIRSCSDIRQFIEVRTVTGGGMWRGEYQGKAVRWYKAIDGEPIFKRKANKTGNYDKVAGTDGCRPIMELDGSMPADLDVDAYIREAEQILVDVGFVPMAPKPRTKKIKA